MTIYEAVDVDDESDDGKSSLNASRHYDDDHHDDGAGAHLMGRDAGGRRHSSGSDTLAEHDWRAALREEGKEDPKKAARKKRRKARELAKRVNFMMKAYGVVVFHLLLSVAVSCVVYVMSTREGSDDLVKEAMELYGKKIFMGSLGALGASWLFNLLSTFPNYALHAFTRRTCIAQTHYLLFTAAQVGLTAYLQAAVKEEDRKIPLLIWMLILAGVAAASSQLLYARCEGMSRLDGFWTNVLVIFVVVALDVMIVSVYQGDGSRADLRPRIIAGGVALGYCLSLANAGLLMVRANFAQYDPQDSKHVFAAAFSLMTVEWFAGVPYWFYRLCIALQK